MVGLTQCSLASCRILQLPEPIWVKDEEELIQWYKDRDLPVPMGGTWNFISKHRRVARW